MSSVQKAIQGLLIAETIGLKWYSPLWHLRNLMLVFRQFGQKIKRELQGYRQAIPHPNPNVQICEDFFCLKHEDYGCTQGNFTDACSVNCFGVQKNDLGTIVSAWVGPNGNPDWLELGCNACKFYIHSCKGVKKNKNETF